MKDRKEKKRQKKEKLQEKYLSDLSGVPGQRAKKQL